MAPDRAVPPPSSAGAAPEEINVGVLVAASPGVGAEALTSFGEGLIVAAEPPLENATQVPWRFHFTEPTRLPDDNVRRPSDFVEEASLRMVEGPYDVVVVLTDVGVMSRRREVVAGLASPASRVVVLSTRRLLTARRGRPARGLSDEAVGRNGAALLLHLLGHVLGLDHSPDGVMAPFRFEDDRGVATFDASLRGQLHARAVELPEIYYRAQGALPTLWFHLRAALRHPGLVLRSLWASRAPLLPLSLPGLATAAVAPTFILVFTAEIWDVGLNMANGVAWFFAVASILAATWYLTGVHNLYFPREDKRLITEHHAVVNVTVLLTMLFAMCGLFAMVGLLTLAIVFFVFPEGLISTWPTLEDPAVDAGDRVRLAAFVSTVAVITGALAGGLESRVVIRHLALFLDEP